MAIGKSNNYTEHAPGLMFIEPKIKKTLFIDDELSRRTAELQSLFVPHGPKYKGVHTCVCGQSSDNSTHYFPDGRRPVWASHSLIYHYVAFHRSEIPEEEMAALELALKQANL